MIDFKAGEKLVKLARATVEKYFENKFSIERIEEKSLNEKRGVFVTIETYPEKNLRGCIGFPYPNLPLYEAVQRAAISSAFEDPRFPRLEKEELNKVVFEISVMTKPKLIKVKDSKEYPNKIEIGKDGLMIQNGPFSGLLLPQVCSKFNWCAEEFLENLCYKACLTPDYIHDKNTKIWKFQCQIFCEKSPRGKVIELTKHSC
jgi:uncharacterized protein (TIGR00296 family)